MDDYDKYTVNGLSNNSYIFWVHIFSRDDDFRFHSVTAKEKSVWHFAIKYSKLLYFMVTFDEAKSRIVVCSFRLKPSPKVFRYS